MVGGSERRCSHSWKPRLHVTADPAWVPVTSSDRVALARRCLRPGDMALCSSCPATRPARPPPAPESPFPTAAPEPRRQGRSSCRCSSDGCWPRPLSLWSPQACSVLPIPTGSPAEYVGACEWPREGRASRPGWGPTPHPERLWSPTLSGSTWLDAGPRVAHVAAALHLGSASGRLVEATGNWELNSCSHQSASGDTDAVTGRSA